MAQQTFFTQYRDTSETFVSAVGDWCLWGFRTPDHGSPALLGWSADLDTTPWLLHGIEECDRHGLALFDAALRVFEDVAGNDRQTKDYLAFAASLRACLEASALAHWMLDPGLSFEGRLTRLGDMTLADIARERDYRRNLVRGAGIRHKWPASRALEDRERAVIETLGRLLGREPVREDTRPPRFGPWASTLKQVASLFAEPGTPGDMTSNQARAAYALLSAPVHVSVSTIQSIYEPALLHDEVHRHRTRPEHRVVGKMLLVAGEALLSAQEAVGARFGWESDPHLRVCLEAIAEVRDSEPS